MNLNFATKSIQINGCPYKILLQNDNGPCALVALANVFLLAPRHAREAQELIYLIKRSNSVSLNDLVQALANIGIQNQHGANTDINQLLQLLPQLHTGLNINPIFNGSFEDGVEMSIFRLYNVGIVHGWIIDGDSDPVAYDHVSKYSYEEAQRVLVQSYDINKNKLQVSNASQILEDANYIKSFLARSATQLTECGLRHLREILVEKSFAILFRNDHFSTIYKNNGELFTLVTDLGFKNRKDIVWQALKSVNGSQDAFYTGNFIPTSLERTETTATAQNDSFVSNPFSDQNETGVGATNTMSELQQIQNDEQLARRLQEENIRDVNSSLQRDNSHSQGRNKNFQNRSSSGNNGEKKKKRDKLKKKCIIM